MRKYRVKCSLCGTVSDIKIMSIKTEQIQYRIVEALEDKKKKENEDLVYCPYCGESNFIEKVR